MSAVKLTVAEGAFKAVVECNAKGSKLDCSLELLPEDDA